MAHPRRQNNPELTEMDLELNRLMRRARQQTNTPSLPAVGSSTADVDVVGNVAPEGENRLTFWLDEARHFVTDNAEENKTDEDEIRRETESPEYPPSLNEEDVEIVLGVAS